MWISKASRLYLVESSSRTLGLSFDKGHRPDQHDLVWEDERPVKDSVMPHLHLLKGLWTPFVPAKGPTTIGIRRR